MNWKKLFKYFGVLLLLGTVIFAFLAHQSLIKIYGGHTIKVDYNAFTVVNKPVYIKNINILSPIGDNFISAQTIYIENGLIESIDSNAIISEEINVIDSEGKFLIPGLIDSHVHLFSSPNDLLLYVANGVTQIREMIGEDDHLRWRRELQKGRIGPDMYIASPRLGSFGLVEGWFMKWSQGFDNVRNAAEAKSLVQRYAKKGYDGIKVYSHLNKEAYDALNKEAKLVGLDVVGHLPWSMELADLWNSNQSEIAHLEEVMNAIRREFGKFETPEGANKFLTYVEKRSKEIVEKLIANDIAVTTTLWLTESFVRQKFELDRVLTEVELDYENPGISEWSDRIPQGLGWLPEINRYKLPENLTSEEKAWQKVFWDTYCRARQIILENLSKGGVKILAGIDANLPPTVPGFSLHDELASMHREGMSTSQVLQSATSTPAQWLESNTGKVMPGYKANLLLLEENPLTGISHTRTINTVILAGLVFNRDLLDLILAKVKTANDASRNIDISQYTNKRD